MFRLMIDSGATAPQIVLHPNVAVLIGRDKLCDVKLDDPSASRVHCRVVADDGLVMLYDAGSRWGTFVNGKRISECKLQLGDRIKVGESIIQLALEHNIDRPNFARQSEHLDRPSRSCNGFCDIPIAPLLPYTVPNPEQSCPGNGQIAPNHFSRFPCEHP